MKTPIINFVNQYKNENNIRLHMPGHKGKKLLGLEDMDITEIDGADSLYFADGIIRESEKNALELFGSDTYYSTEGSSLCIRAMLFLAMTRNKSAGRPICLAARNVHKTFITAAALLDFDVKWVYGKNRSYHSSEVTKEDIERALEKMEEKPFAVYLTSPDYLGTISDIQGISEVCHRYGTILLVDNAHGAYLKFLKPSLHPIDLGADICCDSAHKTFPAYTGTAYLHISDRLDSYYHIHAKEAMNMFASTSPSYLLLESLDFANAYLDEHKKDYQRVAEYIKILKKKLQENGYVLSGDEVLKITIEAASYGYTGNEISDYLLSKKIVSEFHDNDYLVLMPGIQNTEDELNYVLKCLLELPKKNPIIPKQHPYTEKKAVLSIREASLSLREKIKVKDAEGRILADTAVTCPPAVPIVVSGERIDSKDIEMFEYYGITECSVVINKA